MAPWQPLEQPWGCSCCPSAPKGFLGRCCRVWHHLVLGPVLQEGAFFVRTMGCLGEVLGI